MEQDSMQIESSESDLLLQDVMNNLQLENIQS